MQKESPFHSFDPGWAPVLIIYAIIMTVSIIIFRRLYKNYKNIPDKTVEGRLIKTKYVNGTGDPKDDEYNRWPYAIGKYEYFLNGRRHFIKVRTRGTNAPKDKITLYYKKGNRDIRVWEVYSLSAWRFLFLALYFVVGVTILTIIIAKLIGIDIDNLVERQLHVSYLVSVI